MNSLADTGEKINIPMPEKISGEDNSLDIRMRLKQIERYFRAKNRHPSTWGTMAFAFVEKSAASVWHAELTEFERNGNDVTWEVFTETMLSFFGTQLPAREAQVRYKACKQENTVADFVRRIKACVQMLEDTPLRPSMGDVVDHFITNLASAPKEWVLQQAPTEWYQSERDVYMKALQWETNHSHRVEVIKPIESRAPKVFVYKKEFKQDSRKGLKRESIKRKGPFAGRSQSKRAKAGAEGGSTQAAPQRQHRIPGPLYESRIGSGVCFKCGLDGHRASACPNGFRDEKGKTIA